MDSSTAPPFHPISHSFYRRKLLSQSSSLRSVFAICTSFHLPVNPPAPRPFELAGSSSRDIILYFPTVHMNPGDSQSNTPLSPTNTVNPSKNRDCGLLPALCFLEIRVESSLCPDGWDQAVVPCDLPCHMGLVASEPLTPPAASCKTKKAVRTTATQGKKENTRKKKVV